ncbi:hypothetical protein VM1G_07042 [Cytospora mali]|uniref:Uncharacterized protein n=1 Tax=Cytospora mali TaxID=578113 RepID=A0A0M4AFG0_CYTMA|nr:hypothetical protein [Valsa mali]KUI71502.1 hypothetical protein VM1G_07042 [Valsa mali]
MLGFVYLHSESTHGLTTLIHRTRSLWLKMPSVSAFHVIALTTILLSPILLRSSAQDTCVASSQPNPVAQIYANFPTGTFNATLAIIPISLATARDIIPSRFSILESAYRALLPNFPADMYPVLMQAGLDHDIQLAAYNISVPDFQRFGWSFPFIDLLGDGYSSFTWAPAQMISADHQIAINGSRDYGTTVYATDFEPGCDAYGHLRGRATYFRGRATDDSGIYAHLDFSPLEKGTHNPFPVEFYQNITNQPIFGDGTQCDSQVRLFNSTINQGEFAPVPVKGTIFSNLEPLGNMEGLGDVFGLLIDTPFVEYNGLDCASLKGYQGTGSGD